MRTLLICFLLAMASLLPAHNTNYVDNTYIDCQIVNVCCQDFHNFLWLGTDGDGLRRFDGTQFVEYYHQESDSTSIASDQVLSLLIDRSQRLWVGTSNGLQCYQPESDNFRTVRLYGTNVKGYITSILQRRNGEILFVVSGMGLFRLNVETMTGYRIENDERVWLNRFLCTLYEDYHGYLWLGTDREGVVRVDPKTHEEKMYPLQSITVKGLVEDRRGRLYVVTNYAVYRWNRVADRLEVVPYRGGQKDLYYTRALLTSDGSIVIGTSGNGLLQLVPGCEELIDKPLYNPFIDANHTRLTFLFEDRERNLWMGCQYQGLLMLPDMSMPFHFTNKPSSYSKMTGGIAALYYDKEGTLWCSVEGDGIYLLDAEGGIVDYIAVEHTAGAMYEDSEGIFWVGVNGKGLYTLDRRTKQLHLKYPIQGDYVMSCVTEGHDQTLYAAVMGEGILRYDRKSGEFFMTNYQTPVTNRNELVNFWISAILCDSVGHVWTAHQGGVSCYDLQQRAFVHLPFQEMVRVSAYAFWEGKDGKLWIGTQNGLLGYDLQTKRYEVFTTAQGLPDNQVYGIIEDRHGGLWCSTAQGIAYLSPDRKKITSYYTGNGLEDKKYLRGCYAQGKNGIICFGGERGITRFNPDDIYPIKLDKAPCITDLFIRNQKVTRQTLSGGKPVVKQDVIDADCFSLSATDNNFLLYVSTMDFRDARNIIYEYRIHEFEEAWNPTRPGEGRILYPHLPSGSYTLQIRACENGVYSPVKSVRIHVASPWYWTGWAGLVYTLFIIGIGYLLYVSMQRKRREQIGEMKLQFFINIAHEIRSPLTLIVTPLDKLLKREYDADTTKKLLTIRFNANRILRLLNQLLDIRRIDKGQMVIRFAETDMRSFVTGLVDAYVEQAQQKGIALDAEFADSLPAVWVDPDNFDKVLVNLVTNALKYTPEGGHIHVQVSTGNDPRTTGPLQSYMEITVSDTGKGLNEKELKKIFERFYQSGANRSSAPLGFGIGLNLCQLLVKLHHGVIYAENREDTQGSRFVVRLPLGCKHLKKEELAETPAETPLQALRTEAQMDYAKPVEDEKKGRTRTHFKALVIDDDEDLRKYLADNLSAYYRVEMAENGLEGYKKAIAEQPDIIISDVIMPEWDGIRMLRELKKNINTNHIPVILLTSKTEFANRIEGLGQGADGYLGKPFDFDELYALIENLIANRIRLKGKYSGSQTQEDKLTPVTLQADNQVALERIMKAIDANISNPMLNVEMLTQEVGMSRTHLYRCVKESTSLTPSDFIRATRLRQAAELLKSKEYTITQVAYAVGFNSQTHFSNAFKRQYGVSPTEYQEGIKKE